MKAPELVEVGMLTLAGSVAFIVAGVCSALVSELAERVGIHATQHVLVRLLLLAAWFALIYSVLRGWAFAYACERFGAC